MKSPPQFNPSKEALLDSEDDQTAANNVKTTICTFLVLDVYYAATYGYQFIMASVPNDFVKCLAQKILPGVVTMSFIVDVILAAWFLYIFEVQKPRWADHGRLVKLMWVCSALTFILLLARQITVAIVTWNMVTVVLAIIALAIRFLKLRPVYMLNMFIKNITESEDEMTKCRGYVALRKYWCQRRGGQWEKKIVQFLCSISLVVLALVVVIAVSHQAPTGVPSNKVLANKTRPLVLEEYACDDAHCYDGDTAHWYFCDPQSCSDGTPVTVTYDWNMPEEAGYTTGGAITSAAFCAAVGMPELSPFCAVGGAIAGTSYETYKVEEEYWCDTPDSIPATPRYMLWCADGS